MLTVPLFLSSKMFRLSAVAIVFTLLVIVFLNEGDIASSQSRKRGEQEKVMANGTVTLKLNTQFGITPTDTFSLTKRLFTGSTNCSTGGGNYVQVNGVSPAAGHVISLSSLDSVLIETNTTDTNGVISGYQNPDGATIDSLSNNRVCVHGFNDANKNVVAVSSSGVQTLAFDTGSNSCTNTPKYLFNAGEKVCIKAVGSNGTVMQPWKITVSGGRNSQCVFLGPTQFTTETFAQTLTLPANNAAIPGGCAGQTTQITGDWQVRLDDFQQNFRGGINFRVRDPNNVNADVSLFKNLDSSIGFGTQPAGGGIMQWTVSVQNNGPDNAQNPQIVDTLPVGVNFVSITQTSGPTFNCGAPVGQNITCTGVGILRPGQFSSFLISTTYPSSPGGTIFTNNASIFTSTNDLFVTNNTGSAPGQLTGANTPHQCQLAKPDMIVNSTSAAGATVNYSNPTSTGGTCTGTLQCSPATGTVFPIGKNPVGCSIINGDGAGGGQFNVIVVDAQRPDLSITKTSYAPYFQGQQGLYSLDVKNVGALATNGTTVTVTEQPPPGMSIVNMAGTGWTCNVGTYTCTRNTVLAANASYPPIFVTVSFAIYQANGTNITNTATVAGGGDGATSNNTATDLSQVLPLGTGNAVTAAGVMIGGRVLTADGRGLTNARVLITAQNGETRLAITGRLGTFLFDDVESGRTYIISVGSKRFSFSPQVVSVTDDVASLVFVPEN